MQKVFFFNGPPRSGKDTCAEWLERSPYPFKKLEMKEPLLKVCAAIHNLTPSEINHLMLGENKDVPHDLIEGLIFRQELIKIAEEVIKPAYGEDFFGRHMIKRLGKYNSHIAISDSGFDCEALPIIEHVGKENCVLVKLYREGCDYSNDSRSYLSEDLFNEGKVFHVFNNFDLPHLYESLITIYRSSK